MVQQSMFLVLGATGRTGRHFIDKALEDGHRVRALVRTPAKLQRKSDQLDVRQGSITDPIDIDALVTGIDFVVVMLGDREAQVHSKINTDFIKMLVPSMRRQGIKRLLYQAGGLSKPCGGHLSPLLWIIRHTIARGFAGQHKDNEAVMEYLATEATDIEWIVHRAGIGSDGPSKGILQRSGTKFSVSTHHDCALYNYATVSDASAIHTADFSQYTKD